jgi:hypothetical protein
VVNNKVLPKIEVINLGNCNCSNSVDIKFNPPKELMFSKDVVIFTLRGVLPNLVKL